MKNSLNLVLAVLFLAILGCSCPKLSELAKKNENVPPPPVATPNSPQSQSTPAKPSVPSGELTLDKYDQIKTNMPRSDVETLLGGPGVQVSSSTGGGVTFEVRKWQTSDYKTIIITFKNDKVMTKTQVGLK